MKLILLLVLVGIVGCDSDKICYPSPLIGKEDMCHTKAEWELISAQNWAAVTCMERETKGAGYNEKKYQKALKKCNLKEGPSYPIEQIK